MPHSMLRVFDQHWTGKPYPLALITTAAMLALATVFGLVVRHQKLSATRLTMGERVHKQNCPISLQIPRGWRQLKKDGRGNPVLAFDGGTGPRDRYQFRVLTAAAYTPSAQKIGLELLSDISSGVVGEVTDRTWTHLGPLSAVQIVLDRFSCCVAIGPNRQFVALTLAASFPSEEHAANVLSQIMETVEWEGKPLLNSIGALSSRTGLHFEVPPPAVFGPDTQDGIGRIRVLAGAGSQSSWWMDVTQTDLVTGRNPEDLATDMMADNDWNEVRPETIALSDTRRAIRCRHSTDEGLTEYWVIGLEKSKAALVYFKADPSDEPLASAICHRVAETVTISPSPVDIDVSKAILSGQRHAQEVQTKGMSHWWPSRKEQIWFLGLEDDQPALWVSELRQPVTGQTAKFRVTQVYHSRESGRRLKPVKELSWTIDEQGRSPQASADAPAAMLGPGARDIALALAARDQPPQPSVIFGTSAGRPERWHPTFCLPLPPTRNEETGAVQYRALVRDDYSPSSEYLTFDETDQLVREEHDQLVFHLSTEQQISESLSADRMPQIRSR
jgi:hypothetical protein